MKFYVNSSDPNMEGGLAVLEKDDQIAGLELSESFSLCHSAAWTTHLRDIVVVIHGDNYTSVAKNGFDASAVSETLSPHLCAATFLDARELLARDPRDL